MIEYQTLPVGSADLLRLCLKTRITRNGKWVCWEWTGKHCRYNYGRFYLRDRWYTAHKIAWCWLGRSRPRAVPDGMHLDHLCRNTLCIRPSHLEPVTHRENQRRRGEAQKRARTRRSAAGPRARALKAPSIS